MPTSVAPNDSKRLIPGDKYMTFRFEELVGGTISFLGSSGPVEVRKFRATGIPPGAYDAFDFVADYAMQHLARTINTPMGMLHLQDVQITENYYARSYDISAPYGVRKVTDGSGSQFAGAYQLSVDQVGGLV